MTVNYEAKTSVHAKSCSVGCSFALYTKQSKFTTSFHLKKEKRDITSSLSTMPISTAHSSTFSQVSKDFSDRSLQTKP